MTLIRWRPKTELWDPFANIADIQDEMNRMFNTSLRRMTGAEGAFAPAMDVLEEKDKLIVKAELPGISKDDVNVTFHDGYLTVRGEKKHETESQDANYYHSERVYGTFARTIQLPTAVDVKKVEARFKDGVLFVTLPKTEEAKPKQIDIKVN